jgi:hypothetical protein
MCQVLRISRTARLHSSTISIGEVSRSRRAPIRHRLLNWNITSLNTYRESIISTINNGNAHHRVGLCRGAEHPSVPPERGIITKSKIWMTAEVTLDSTPKSRDSLNSCRLYISTIACTNLTFLLHISYMSQF